MSASASMSIFKQLQRHFVIATSKARPAIVEAHLEKQTPYEEVSEEIYQAAQGSGESLNPIFKNFCLEGERIFSLERKSEANDGVQENLGKPNLELYERTISDYLFLRQACFLELQIMDLNRVGVEKDLSKIISQTARHVGLEMPISWKGDKEDSSQRKSEEKPDKI